MIPCHPATDKNIIQHYVLRHSIHFGRISLPWQWSHVGALVSDDARRRSRHCQISVIIFYYHSSFRFLSKWQIKREIRSHLLTAGNSLSAYCVHCVSGSKSLMKIYRHCSWRDASQNSSGILQFLSHSFVVINMYVFFSKFLLSALTSQSLDGLCHFSSFQTNQKVEEKKIMHKRKVSMNLLPNSSLVTQNFMSFVFFIVFITRCLRSLFWHSSIEP